MKFIADTHTHTIASTHAYSTILENAKFASENSIEYIAMTDHAPTLTDAPHLWHFLNIHTIPDYLYGVRILKGVEVNITPTGLDLTNEQLSILEWVVASIHAPLYPETTVEKVTESYINAAKNPHVDVIGHSGYVRYKYDYERAVKAFAEYEKLVEINEHSFHARADGIKNCAEIAKLCKKYNVPIVLNSDAHFAYDIGKFDNAIAMLDEIGFPHEQIINSNKAMFEAYLAKRKIRTA